MYCIRRLRVLLAAVLDTIYTRMKYVLVHPVQVYNDPVTFGQSCYLAVLTISQIYYTCILYNVYNGYVERV